MCGGGGPFDVSGGSRRVFFFFLFFLPPAWAEEGEAEEGMGAWEPRADRERRVYVRSLSRAPPPPRATGVEAGTRGFAEGPASYAFWVPRVQGRG